MERKGDLQPISVDVKGSMRLPMASESDAGIYTCLVDVSLDGKNYTSAHSIRLIIDNSTYCRSHEPQLSTGSMYDGELVVIVIYVSTFKK